MNRLPKKDSFEVISKEPRTSLDKNAFFKKSNAFYLTPPDWRIALERREMLLEYAVANVEKSGRRKDFSTVTDIIDRELNCKPEGQPPLSDHIVQITNYGLRELMRYFAQYSWVTDYDELGGLPIDRFVHQYPVGLLTFILGGNRRFHQFTSGFPNVYLSYILPRSDDATSAENNAHIHRHTYWLKRLLIQYVSTKQAGGRRVDVSDILDTFHAGGDGYEVNIIKACLGSLSDANCSNMIQVVRERHVDAGVSRLRIKSVRLTARGKHCLKHIFDRFFYLQLVVDDHMLPIPKVVFEDFHIPESEIDYGYVVRPVNEYFKAARQMIGLKAKRVLHFVQILEISLEIERGLYPVVFNRLERDRIPIPASGDLWSGVFEEIERVGSYRQVHVDAGPIQKSVLAKKKEVEKQLKLAYAAGARYKPPERL